MFSAKGLLTILKFLEGHTDNIAFHFEMRFSCIIYLQIYSQTGNVPIFFVFLNDIVENLRHSSKQFPCQYYSGPYGIFWSALSGLVFKWWGFHCIPGVLISSLIDFILGKCFALVQIYAVIVLIPFIPPLFPFFLLLILLYASTLTALFIFIPRWSVHCIKSKISFVEWFTLLKSSY